LLYGTPNAAICSAATHYPVRSESATAPAQLLHRCRNKPHSGNAFSRLHKACCSATWYPRTKPL